MLVIEKFKQQIKNAKQISDAEGFITLMKMGEFFTKITTLSTIAALKETKQRIQYKYLYEIVTADGIGTWAKVIDQILGTAVSINLIREFSEERSELMMNQTENSWGYNVIMDLYKCKETVTQKNTAYNTKPKLKDWFRNFADLRNDYAHNRVSLSDYKLLIPYLEKSLTTFIENFSLFKKQWLYVYKTNGALIKTIKLNEPNYNTTFLDKTYVEDGIYLCFENNESIYINLFSTNLTLNDFFLPNGRFSDKKFELISYLTSDTIEMDSKYFLSPLEELPKSETNGLEKLELINSLFTNIPTITRKYIERNEIEEKLYEALIDSKRWPIVSLRGRGGIGKTSTAIEVLKKITQETRYDAIIWFSSRDIDFNEYGNPINVQQRIFTKDDIADEYLDLIEHPDRKIKTFQKKDFFTKQLSQNLFGKILFVFDNFETIERPIEIFEWLENYIELPNKILITTRHREFTTDKQIEVDGMKLNEFLQLVTSISLDFKIDNLLDEKTNSQLYKISQGHPYVIKILLGEIANTKSTLNLNRVFENKDQILQALFERTYDKLKPLSQKVFQVLCNWRSVIPEIALEATITCNPLNNDDDMYEYDIQEAVDELRVFSFIEILNPKENYKFINVPLAASLFGLSKYKSNPNKAEILFYTKLLQDFGASQVIHINDGLEPRIRYFFTTIRQKIDTEESFRKKYLDIILFISRRFNKAKLLLADLYEEQFKDLSSAKKYLSEYLREELNDETKEHFWDRLAKFYLSENKIENYYQTLIEKYEYKDCSLLKLCLLARDLSESIRNKKFENVRKDIRYEILNRIIKRIESHSTFSKLKPIQYANLAWLYIHIGNSDTAKKLAKKGFSLEHNRPCQEIINKLDEKPKR